MMAYQQGVLLSSKVTDMGIRMDKAVIEGRNDFYHILWNELTVYTGMADMYAIYFSKISDEADELLSALELLVYVNMPQ